MRSHKTPPLLPSQIRHSWDLMPTIFARTADAFGVPRDRLFEGGRMQPAALARQVAMYLAIELTGARQVDLAAIFDRDHSAVGYAHETIRAYIETSTKFAAEIDGLSGVILRGRAES